MRQTLSKYVLLERIGEGGFGTVFKAHDPTLDRLVAIKVCTLADTEARQRFLREARIAARLTHPGIATIYELGEEESNLFIAQEYLGGEDLAARIAVPGAYSTPQKIRILEQLARALAFAHQNGVVHRDVKPSNVRILPGMIVKLMDFGIARLEVAETRLTKTGTVIGTLSYMAPEQLDFGIVDSRADIFAFGVVAYELISTSRPFAGDTNSMICARILTHHPHPLTVRMPDCPPALAYLVEQCLAKNPADRIQSLDEVARTLTLLVDTPPADGYRSPAGEKNRPIRVTEIWPANEGSAAAGATGLSPPVEPRTEPELRETPQRASRSGARALVLAAGAAALVLAAAVVVFTALSLLPLRTTAPGAGKTPESPALQAQAPAVTPLPVPDQPPSERQISATPVRVVAAPVARQVSLPQDHVGATPPGRGSLGIVSADAGLVDCGAAALGLVGGTCVLEILPGAAPGLLPGDLILGLGSRSMPSPDALSRAVTRLQPGDRAMLEVVRGGVRTKVAVTISDGKRLAATDSE